MMKKHAIFLLLAILVGGCQSTNPGIPEDRLATLRCWHFRDQPSVTPEQIEYIRKRSRNGDLVCKTVLAHMYERGLGMPVDIAQARAIYQSIADVNESLYSELGRLAEQGIGEPVDYVKARRLYERAVVQPGNTLGSIQLARLLEEGKGGPQDRHRAMALYASSIKLYQDTAWKSVQRLHAEGLALNAEQQKRYNEAWANGITKTITAKTLDVQKELSQSFKPDPSNNPIKLKLQFSQGSDAPKVILLESSGNPSLDLATLESMGNYRLPDEPIMTEGSQTWSATQYVHPPSR